MATHTLPYYPAQDRYENATFRRVGHSGLQLPPLSLGLWHNFGDDKPLETQREIIRGAFDRGITHFDLANNYGPPNGSAEKNFGRILREDLSAHRDELIISSKAGWYMHEGPYGFGGSRKYLVSSLDRSLASLGVDYVDIFYHHRPDPDTPLEETMYALRDIVASGKALYVGISSYGPELTAQAAEFMADEGCPLLIHQPSYSILNRWVEEEGEDGQSLLEAAAEAGLGVIAFSPLAQGLLTDKYLDGVPADSRAAAHKSLSEDMLSEANLAMVRRLSEIAANRGQTLAQMALAWVLREQGDYGELTVTSTVTGASSIAQLDSNLKALDNLHFDAEELALIDAAASDAGINIWAAATDSKRRES
ncbi:L-glyceraldehyde 3-phosphate reductase [Corynebacterium uberis]|uniref:L-glyceraldehyde 3-phosphate reductase n=1 Tax=Corynebacterium TaxID=1716 RepID=UPI001D09CF61|nr:MULTISPECIES: L-glyceraldehyde 3-phosphate reductase [Corynebacterium]MCZ9309095.1 L-glyceraldehyde 3-phosphate reductase [Corynebacterium sp. c6VSa_13]UDL74439.1 L-glyceraldehyde 3-phosphate reductase [Corynebacterium uberis]UDL76726.1 L-glyceraldehyde 3-phosphate reductase [Corynebacterium uberis]UDL78939.1 L-glyceraldehyde 3-phosphate reductase [Corynebacterium uberis]UDL81217.1 L-glyceraldehyde 3-phosphate reductase [Corynebacterium uberis]